MADDDAQTVDGEDRPLDLLLARARAGDAKALGGLLTRLRPLLFHVAHRHSSPALPAEDLVSTATLRFIEAIAKGGGPSSHPGAYLTASIKNLATDHLRSKGSRTVSLDAYDVDDARVETTSPHEASAVELLIEMEALREAFNRLTDAHRHLLRALVIEGRKPSEVAAASGSKPNTVSVQTARAKKQLAVAIRVVLLERSAAEGCEPHRAELARHGGPSSAAATAHVEQCRRCAGALAAFRAIPGVLACLPLISVAGGAAATAVASAPTRQNGPGSGRPAAIGIALAGVCIAAAAALALVFPSLVATSMTDAGANAIPESSLDSAELQNPVSFDGSVSEGAGVTSIEIDLDVHDTGAGPFDLSVTLPPTMEASAVPDGWQCDSAPGEVTCDVPAQSGQYAIIVESTSGAPTFGDMAVSLQASSGQLATIGQLEGVIVVR